MSLWFKSVCAMLLLCFPFSSSLSEERVSEQLLLTNNNSFTLNDLQNLANTVLDSAIDQYAYPVYKAYFQTVAENVITYRLHQNYKNVFIKSGMFADNIESLNSIRFGFSPYLSSAVNKVAMTDCKVVYFPHKAFVEKLSEGKQITEKEMRLLLHEIGHVRQCEQTSRELFAKRWFSDLSPAAVSAIKSGKIETKIIHDAMPLEKEAEHFSRSMYQEIMKH